MSVERFVGETRFRSNFINYRGLVDEMGAAHSVVTLSQDVAELEKGLTYKANYMIELAGGLGDVVESEPAVRFMVKTLCPNENVVLVTRNPEIFEHLKVPMYHTDMEVPERHTYLKLQNMGRIEDVFFHFIMPHDTHYADIAALRIMKRTLPIQERNITLSEGERPTIGADFPWERAIIVHPGKGWDSKTFPADVWESYIETFIRNGINVVIIGKKIDEKQGYIALNMEKLEDTASRGPARILDTRDKLDMRELFWVISKCPGLISNDSAPVHIAGAYDNHIGIIATCKHPDYILPYRKGNPYYKAVNLEERKLYLENRLPPNYIDSATIDHASEESMRAAAPDPMKVLRWVDTFLDPNPKIP
jgi:ADP-heptose:LPS heptosyltransferase